MGIEESGLCRMQSRMKLWAIFLLFRYVLEGMVVTIDIEVLGLAAPLCRAVAWVEDRARKEGRCGRLSWELGRRWLAGTLLLMTISG